MLTFNSAIRHKYFNILSKLKGALCSFATKFQSEEKKLFLPKQTK